MIISHNHKLIFLKPRKVAGTSLEIALSRYLSRDDIVTRISSADELDRKNRGYIGARNYRKPILDLMVKPTVNDLKSLLRFRYPRKYFNHMTAEMVRDIVSPDIWNSYTKVSIVRNPWDYAISYFYYANGRDTTVNFEEWCLSNSQSLNRNIEQYMIGGEVVVDRFVRFENFKEDLLSLEMEIPTLAGLYDTFSSIHAKGGIRPKKGTTVSEVFASRPLLDPLFRELFSFEIERFDYRKPS